MNKRNPKIKKYLLDKEEKEILKAVESGKWPIRKLTKSELTLLGTVPV